MAKKLEEQPRAGKKRRGPPVKPVESDSDSEGSDSDDGVMGDEFQCLSDEVESGDEERDGFIVDTEEEDEEEDEEGEGAKEEMAERPRRLMRRIIDAGGSWSEGSESSMEGSRSRSEEDLRDIGSARRLDDDDTGDSAWKEAAGGAGGAGVVEVEVAGPSESLGLEKESAETGSGSGGDVAVVRVVDNEETEAIDTDDEDEEDDEEEDEEEEEAGSVEAESESEGEPSASVLLEDGSDSDKGGGGKGEDSKTSAYSRAFSKILKQSKVVKESDTGPVLAARQTLVARKLEEEAGDSKEKKVTMKEKKELREKAHIYPQSYTDNKEKELVRLATRGVVKLFNAVSKAQKVQATSDSRDAKVVAKQSKSAFLAEVRGTGTSSAVGNKRNKSSASAPPFKFGTSEAQNQPTSRWSVVKDDFMLGKQKLKDWDKDEMGDAAGVQQLNNEIDDDSD